MNNKFEQGEPKETQKEPIELIKEGEVFPVQKIQDEIITELGRPGDPIHVYSRDIFFEKMGRGEINEQDFKRFVKKKKWPLSEGNESNTIINLFGQIKNDPEDARQIKGIIAWLIRSDFSLRDEVKESDLRKFLKKYSEPISFENDIKKFLTKLTVKGEDKNSALVVDKREQYRKVVLKLMKLVYGERYKYWEQFKILQKAARGE
ncbi:hypothetical protein KKH07_00420 [Patescibacteria group bacterium]|nr:hypothetical protein [Patescibacteria group bacterium]